MADNERFSVYFALDGPHLDGLIGSAGVLRFDWPEKSIHIQHFDGISAAHNVSVAPNNELALLGNFSQQIVLLDVRDPDNMTIADRQTTLCLEDCAYRLRSNTHHLWYPESDRFIGAVGDNLYEFTVGKLDAPKRLGPHLLENAHELRWDKSRRYVLIGDLGPERYDVRQVAIYDLETNRCQRIRVQNNVWHVCVHPSKPVGYAFTYSFSTDNEDYVAWSPAYVREYIYEINLVTANIDRVWSCGAEFPIHLNSDVSVTEDEVLTIASGGSHAVVQIPLENFDRAQVTRVMPGFFRRLVQKPKLARNLVGAFGRRPVSDTHDIIQTLEMTDGKVTDGVYAARVSPGGKYLVVGHRGYNYLVVYERKTMKRVFHKVLPFRRDDYSRWPHYTLGRRGHHLGIHHSELIAR